MGRLLKLFFKKAIKMIDSVIERVKPRNESLDVHYTIHMSAFTKVLLAKEPGTTDMAFFTRDLYQAVNTDECTWRPIG